MPLCAKYSPGAIELTPQTVFQINACFPLELQTFWNPEVIEDVVTIDGVAAKLSASAIERIKSKYKGTPLIAYVSHRTPGCCEDCGCCGCDCNCCCSCCTCCCACDCCNCDKCTPRITTSATIYAIPFGKKSRSAACPGCCTLFCLACATCSNDCCVDRVLIEPNTVAFNVPSDSVLSKMVAGPELNRMMALESMDGRGVRKMPLVGEDFFEMQRKMTVGSHKQSTKTGGSQALLSNQMK